MHNVDMRWPQDFSARQWLANLWLVLSIHVHAFQADPAAYLGAARWWLLRKRVRARGQFAPLLSRSPLAYSYWAWRQVGLGPANHSPVGSPPIIALVADTGDPAAMERSRQSLAAEGVTALLVTDEQPLAVTIDSAEVAWAAAPWFLVMSAGDQLAAGAAAAYRGAIAGTTANLIYADDDLIGPNDRRTAPHFKPDWNSALFEHCDYLTGACIIRSSKVAMASVSGCADWQARMVALAAAQSDAHHIRQVLHHRVARPPLPVKSLPIAIAADLPRVSIVIPTRNRLDLLRTCLDGVAATAYPDVEVIVVDNDSDDPDTLAYLASQDPARVRVLRHAGPFNYSAINNRAVAEARGKLLCLLNNDIEVMAPDWLAIMATQALRDDVGAVGAQLLYPDGRIQHAGVVIGVGNAAGHAHRFINPTAEGYFRRHALPQFTTAVTGACLVVARDRFLAVGGLDEANFAVAFNDVDLCLKLNRRGWQSFYEPRAVLIHHESVSRGDDRDPVGAARFAGELAALQRIWHTDQIVDPFHHPHLSRASEQFAVAL